MRIKREEAKVKPQMKLAEDFLDLRTVDTNIIVEKLEESIKLRELPVKERFKRELKKI